ncbi:MAG TPA: periplasmic heavy metal sensor [Hyphomicrobiaceae bacterium]|nr:periplasmic heavy metal sensor [Hyphomicrobiaceae bacterium]
MTDAGESAVRSFRRTPRWVLGLMFVSLALNLVVVGAIAGAAWRFRGPPPWANAVTPNLLGYASTLAPERRRELWQLIAEERQHVRPFRREVRAAREKTIEALVAEPFDRETFLAAQARQAETENRARAAVQQLYVKIAEQLTPEERRAFPHWRERRRHPGGNLLDEPDHQAGEPSSSK